MEISDLSPAATTSLYSRLGPENISRDIASGVGRRIADEIKVKSKQNRQV